MAHKTQFMSIVDDEPDIAYLYRDALSTIQGIQVFAFSDPLLALEHFRLNPESYRVVISDYRMPALNGTELLTEIKKINHSIMTILISAFEVKDYVFKDCKCIDKFLQKPIAMSSLIEEVQQQLGIKVEKINSLKDVKLRLF